MKLSIVSTLYQSAPHLKEFHQRVSKAAKQLVGDDYEIILVNDGSPDNSLEIATKIVKEDKHVVVVDLSRNFGHHKAIMTGLDYTSGEHIFLIDSDLEEEPEWLLSFSKQLSEENCNVVYGIQKTRKGGFFERFSGNWFYQFFNILTGLNLPKNIVTARIMTRNYVDALLLHKEREIFLAGLWHITGFDQRAMIVNKSNTSPTSYSLRHRISLFVNSVTSFSNAPLRMIFYLGVIISSISSIYVAYLVVNRIFGGGALSGWTSVIASVWLLGGLIIAFIGIIGIYLAKIFSETKQRPYTIVKQVYDKRK